ncbi:hypothetical protein IWZ03DRAFT_357182 [Phyllosticta citriasiana]|uniref:Uncharacterized protein n=1 Tax=Phyllosticta citriasiana TaxID=595635 RepID=A0ABR1KTR6_9PEZI
MEAYERKKNDQVEICGAESSIEDVFLARDKVTTELNNDARSCGLKLSTTAVFEFQIRRVVVFGAKSPESAFRQEFDLCRQKIPDRGQQSEDHVGSRKASSQTSPTPHSHFPTLASVGPSARMSAITTHHRPDYPRDYMGPAAQLQSDVINHAGQERTADELGLGLGTVEDPAVGLIRAAQRSDRQAGHLVWCTPRSEEERERVSPPTGTSEVTLRGEASGYRRLGAGSERRAERKRRTWRESMAADVTNEMRGTKGKDRQHDTRSLGTHLPIKRARMSNATTTKARSKRKRARQPAFPNKRTNASPPRASNASIPVSKGRRKRVNSTAVAANAAAAATVREATVVVEEKVVVSAPKEDDEAMDRE